MDFYTNVIQRGNTLFVRGVDGNQRVTDKVKYCPILFDITNKGETGYKTLDGRDVLPHPFDSIQEAKDWIEQSSDQDIVFGNTQFPYCYIGDKYPNNIPWDKD